MPATIPKRSSSADNLETSAPFATAAIPRSSTAP
jgi:hypothetical protein